MQAVNPFLIELLELQQDGGQAISAPTNWDKPPILEVKTLLDESIDNLLKELIGGADPSIGRWHFLVGSPGNGKSAAVGKLVNILRDTHHYIIQDEEEVHLDDLPATSMPYALDVLEEKENKKYKTIKIVQDASVVRKPFSADKDPSDDLLKTLEKAWTDGLSLVICTNRGVLEKAYRDPEYRSKPWHKKFLRPLIDHTSPLPFKEGPIQTESKKPRFKSIVATADFLDTRSLLLNPSDVFERLIKKATTDTLWEECTQCSSRYLCPLKGNRDWLVDPAGRKAVVLSFRRAETLSSQVIVLREALAALSFLLAGCARDYSDTNPCNWVHTLVASEDYFALASRRIYMSLYASTSPRGLDHNAKVRDRQKAGLKALLTHLPDESMELNTLKATLNLPQPSTDVGVKRLLGADGVFSKLNVTNGPLPPALFDRWDGDTFDAQSPNLPYVTGLETRCAKVWALLENAAEGIPTHKAVEAYWSLRRWRSQFTLHFGALAETKLFDQNTDSDFASSPLAHIDNFSDLIVHLANQEAPHDNESTLNLLELKEMLGKLLSQTDTKIDDRAAITLTPNVSIYGQWFQTNLRPQPKPSPASGSLTVAVYFDAHEYTTLTAPMYLWLRQQYLGTMVKDCIPTTTLREAIDAKSRAAAKSGYAHADDEVVMRIEGERETFELTRASGRVALKTQIHKR